MQILQYAMMGMIVARCSQSYMDVPMSNRIRIRGPSKLFPPLFSQRNNPDIEQARSDESRSLESCCDEDFCFPEPPSTEAGNSIYSCYISMNYPWYLNLFLSWIAKLLTKIYLVCFLLIEGLTIRCLLTKNGLDVEWVNPEDEVKSTVEPLKNKQTEVLSELEDEDDDEDEEWYKRMPLE